MVSKSIDCDSVYFVVVVFVVVVADDDDDESASELSLLSVTPSIAVIMTRDKVFFHKFFASCKRAENDFFTDISLRMLMRA